MQQWNYGVYKGFGYLVALAIISSQVVLVYLVVPYSIGLCAQLLVFICAYLCTDFINGLTHMYADTLNVMRIWDVANRKCVHIIDPLSADYGTD